MNGGSYEIPYPMARGYADIFGISKKVLYSIARTCGIFSAMNLFVELALPTAIVLNVARDRVIEEKQTTYRCVALWGNDEVENYESRYDCDLRKLLNEWEKDVLFVHPVKLSKWKGEFFSR